MPRRKKGKRRTKSDTPNVVVYRTKANTRDRPRWRGKWRDPETGKIRFKDLVREYPTEEERQGWAERKSAAIIKQKENLENKKPAPEPEPIRTTVLDAVEGFYERRGPELRPATVEAYRKGTDVFVTWAKTEGISHVEDVKTVHLDTFRSYLITRPLEIKRKVQGKRKKGQARRRSPGGVNKDLRSVRALANDLRRVGLLPLLDSDGIRDGLRAVKAPRPVVTFLRGLEIRTLLDAAIRHDRERFRETRAEHVGEGEPGSTPRYLPVASFLTTVLLTGARFGEIASLQWDAVDLDHGEILLSPEDVKTHHGRRIPLDVTPGLTALLGALRLRSAGRGPYVFGPEGKAPLGSPTAAGALRRLARFGARKGLSWQLLRRTCAAHLASAPGVYGSAAAFHAAKRLGHSVVVAERHYAGAIGDIPAEARTIEAAMGIEEEVGRVVEAVSGIEPAEAVASA